MAKTSSKFVCQQCGYEAPKWMGKCPSCGTWGSLVETVIETPKGKARGTKQVSAVKPQSLSRIKLGKAVRISTKIAELDRVLGGGVVTGQTILLAGSPGVGKSTLLLQLSEKLGKALYISGEESAQQIALRAQRLGVGGKKIEILETTDADEILGVLGSSGRSILVVDSIQTLSTDDLSGMAGSVGQVRECTFRLVQAAKRAGTILFIVGHVTKEGTVAGPAVLAHIVDTVIWFEGDSLRTFRILRAVKNRFGPTDEVGIFTMGQKGLESVADAAKIFLSSGGKPMAGSVITSTMEGTRPILVEVQSLVVPTRMAFPKRVAQGIDSRRLELLLAVLTRRVGIPLGEFDCFVNIVGGMNIKDPGADLAVCLSILSAYFDKPLPKGFLAIGEVGLLGEVRAVTWQEKIIKDARRQGYSKIVSSREVKYLSQAVKAFLK